MQDPFANFYARKAGVSQVNSGTNMMRRKEGAGSGSNPFGEDEAITNPFGDTTDEAITNPFGDDIDEAIVNPFGDETGGAITNPFVGQSDEMPASSSGSALASSAASSAGINPFCDAVSPSSVNSSEIPAGSNPFEEAPVALSSSSNFDETPTAVRANPVADRNFDTISRRSSVDDTVRCKLSAAVTGYEVVKGSGGEYVEYVVSVTAGLDNSAAIESFISWEVRRRNSQFESLHKSLATLKPPPLPKKLWGRSFDATYLVSQRMSLNDYLSEVVERHGEQHFVAAWLADSWSSLLVPLLQGRVEDRVRKHELQLHLSEFVQKHSMAQGALGVESRRRQELEQTTKRAQEQSRNALASLELERREREVEKAQVVEERRVERAEWAEERQAMIDKEVVTEGELCILAGKYNELQQKQQQQHSTQQQQQTIGSASLLSPFVDDRTLIESVEQLSHVPATDEIASESATATMPLSAASSNPFDDDETDEHDGPWRAVLREPLFDTPPIDWACSRCQASNKMSALYCNKCRAVRAVLVPIKLQIVSVAKVHGNSESYVQYEIEADFYGYKWRVLRRFSDFLDLFKGLVGFFGKADRIPPLPPSSLSLSWFDGASEQFDPVFLQQRKAGLQTFLSAVVANPIFVHTGPLGAWLLTNNLADVLCPVLLLTAKRHAQLRRAIEELLGVKDHNRDLVLGAGVAMEAGVLHQRQMKDLVAQAGKKMHEQEAATARWQERAGTATVKVSQLTKDLAQNRQEPRTHLNDVEESTREQGTDVNDLTKDLRRSREEHAVQSRELAVANEELSMLRCVLQDRTRELEEQLSARQERIDELVATHNVEDPSEILQSLS